MSYPVGNKGRSNGQQIDHPDRDDAASTSSAISLQENIGLLSEEDEGPPSYSESTNTQISPHEPSANGIQGPPPDLDSRIESWIKEDLKGGTYSRMSSSLTKDPVALRKFIEYSATVAPQAYVSIRGEHTKTTKSASGGKQKQIIVDFDFRIDVTETFTHLNNDGHSVNRTGWNRLSLAPNERKTYRGTRIKKAHKQGQGNFEALANAPSLDEWCHLFCASSSILKSFTLRHVIFDRDEASIREQITSYIRAMSYRGNIVISFPLYNRTITILSDHPINRYRNNRWIYILCLVLQFWIFTWPILFFMTKRWAVVDSEWLYKTPSERLPDASTYFSEPEANWCARWRYTMQRAVLESRVGKSAIQHVEEPLLDSRPDPIDHIIMARLLGSGALNDQLSLGGNRFRILPERQSDAGWGYNT